MNTAKNKNSSFFTMIWVALSCIMTGGVIGGTTNAVNGYISPVYFQNILGWDFPGIYFAIVVQGIVEGLIYGLLFALLFIVIVYFILKLDLSYRFFLKYFFKIIVLIYSCWLLGGLIGIGLAALSPEFFQEFFYLVPEDNILISGYAWVGGSITGAMLGGIFGLVIAIVRLRKEWGRNTT